MARFLFAGWILLLITSVTLADDKFIVHEWGTFSTFSGSNGKLQKFAPDDTDLPDFVHSNRRNIKGGPSDALVSLETPVLYFYSDSDRIASVHVDFPNGAMTEWYPEASRPPQRQLRWDNFMIHGTAKPKLVKESEKGRYFAARDVDAKSLTSAEPSNKPESEKFLFYRGVGDFELPIKVSAGEGGQFVIANTGKQSIPASFLITVQDKKVRYVVNREIKPQATATMMMPPGWATDELLVGEVVQALIKQGLYEKEAIAMVKTWQSAWFGEDGTRVLYLLSESVTNELLPTTITPKPDQFLRVLVGRHDVLSPEAERHIDALVRRVNGPSNDDAKQADREMRKFGRYRFAAQKASEIRLMK